MSYSTLLRSDSHVPLDTQFGTLLDISGKRSRTNCESDVELHPQARQA